MYKILIILLSILIINSIYAQHEENHTSVDTKIYSQEEQEIIKLSLNKWRWMADIKMDSLNILFDDKSMFVHMRGSWGKQQELDVIKSGGIWYKKADVQEVSINIIDKTAILLNKITLLAVVGGREVTNQFMVTEVYIYQKNHWCLGALSFTKLLTPEDIKK